MATVPIDPQGERQTDSVKAPALSPGNTNVSLFFFFLTCSRNALPEIKQI